MPDVWPVIATRGRPQWIRRQLDALKPQLTGDERIVVVVDGDIDTALALADEPPGKVLVVPIGNQVGVYRARRAGNSQVPYDAVVCEIDDHDLAAPELLARLRAAFAKPDIMMAYCDVWMTDSGETIKRAHKPKGKQSFVTGGQVALGMKAYRRWLYDLAGGHPTCYVAGGDYRLMVSLETLAGIEAVAYIE
ncbi:MAG TPA: glycosyltransferase family A protein, partial [Vicinamibacterales bacterium]|nr:glycosyltransferase family A protein [Vicinamibacterales bacterium]